MSHRTAAAPVALLLALAACGAPETGGELALSGPYREPNDPCRWVAPTPDTALLMQTDTDLVACPADFAGTDIFIADVNATEVGRMSGYILYRVPQPWRG